MIKDLIRIYQLVKELIWLYHPITMDIRWTFHSILSHMSFTKQWKERKDWERYIKKGNSDGVKIFFNALLKNKRFRENIIAVLTYEKETIREIFDEQERYIFSKLHKSAALFLISLEGKEFLYQSLKYKEEQEVKYLEWKFQQDKLRQDNHFIERQKGYDTLYGGHEDFPTLYGDDY